MKCFKYIGDHADLRGEEALGQWHGDNFVVQCHGHRHLGQSVPALLVEHWTGRLEDWARGWHETPREDWEFVEEPKFKGTRDECAEFIRANRFGLVCDAWLDRDHWVVFGDPHVDN